MGYSFYSADNLPEAMKILKNNKIDVIILDIILKKREDSGMINVVAEQGYEFSCTVTNTGKIPGKEVVQLYIAAPGKTMVKPQKELKAFAKTKILAPGEREVVRLVIGLSELASFDEQASCWAVESGRYLAIWGSSSRDCRLKQSFTLRQAVTGEEVHRVLLPVRQLEELY